MSLVLLWIIYITRVAGREHRFATGIAWGTIPSGFPVFWVVVPECSRNSYRTSPDLCVSSEKNSSSLDKAPKMRDSVRLNSLESFLMTIPSISSETWEMYSSAIPGSSVFFHWLFLVFFGVSLGTAANFVVLLNVAKSLKEKLCRL